MCLIHDNAGSNTYLLVQDFLELENVVQLRNPPYSPDLSLCFVLYWKTLSPDVDISLKMLLVVPLFSVYVIVMVSSVSLSLSHWYPGSGVVLDCIDSLSLHHYLLIPWVVRLYVEIIYEL